ncbi:MAG: hypothetical protein ACYCVN_12380 [Acidimicrobiales bacterium]
MTIKLPSIGALSAAGGIAIVACSTVLLGLHDAVPAWMPYLAVFLFGHGAGASTASAALSGTAQTAAASTAAARPAQVAQVTSTPVNAGTSA